LGWDWYLKIVDIVSLRKYTENGGAVLLRLTAEIISTRPICKEKGRYIGWPTICRRSNGELLAVFSGDRDWHVCPWGKTEMIRSTDNGATWSKPVTINNTPLDDRDAGIIETKDGTLVASWFTSLAFLQNLNAEYVKRAMPDRDAWVRHIEKLTPEIKEEWLGNYISRSVDGGVTWSKPIRVKLSAPHGPIELFDGRLLYVGLNLRTKEKREACADISTDGGVTWQTVGVIPIPESYIGWYYEPHVVETYGGKLVVLFRCQPGDGNDYMRQSESTDGGRTWSIPLITPIFGHPAHLLRLKNGWLLASYGLRRLPFGERACISRDDGATWDYDQEVDICHPTGDELNYAGDLGYPASVELADGSIYTVYYQIDQPGEKPCLMATHWKIV